MNSTGWRAAFEVEEFSARTGVNVLETPDFLLGFVGIDIAGDDPQR